MTLVIWVNFFPKIFRVTKEQNKGRTVPHELIFDFAEFTFNVLVSLTELTNDSDYVVTPINLILCCSTAFVDNEVGVDEQFHFLE